ncbi:MAG: TniB family NTP-binding protein, partial [Pseudomonadota bacterium]|nr:TniB family NTP-binding protein [Pseudomonadota bacterium]
QVEQQIEQLIRLPRRIRMPGLFLCADSGMGKTHLLRRIERRHPERDDPATKRHIRPVLYVQVPAAPSVRTLRRTLIDEANIPFIDHPSRPLPESLLRRALAAAGTELIVLDEIHNIEHMRWHHRVQMRDWVRCLSNETQRPIILAGTDEFEPAVLTDRQMASRYPIVRLPRWTMGEAFAALLQGYERACPLRLASRLSDPLLMRSLLDETDGITDSIVRCLQAAALVAIRERTERIVPEYLSWWRDPPLLSYYEKRDEEPESVALARAWLRDERRAAPARSPPAVRRFRNRASLSTEGGPCALPY